MKLSCQKCSNVFIVRNTDIKEFKVEDFICPDCQKPLKKVKKLPETGRVISISWKKILTEAAKAKLLHVMLRRVLGDKVNEVYNNSPITLS